MFSAQCKSSEVLHKLHSFFCQNSSLAEIAFSFFFFFFLSFALNLLSEHGEKGFSYMYALQT